MAIAYSARSHVGKVRDNNEDNLYIDGIILPSDAGGRSFSIDGKTDTPAIFAVCDGMGGESDGEIASLLTVKTLGKMAAQIKSALPKKWNKMIQTYAEHANDAIQLIAEGKRIGTTLALAIVTVAGVHCFNIGDSRIYALRQPPLVSFRLLRKNIFEQVTTDHTFEGGHRLTRCIGIGDARTVDNYSPIYDKCRILICTDGLTDMVSDKEIKKAMCNFENPAETANVLLDTALKNGGNDNVTLIVIDAN